MKIIKVKCKDDNWELNDSASYGEGGYSVRLVILDDPKSETRFANNRAPQKWEVTFMGPKSVLEKKVYDMTKSRSDLNFMMAMGAYHKYIKQIAQNIFETYK